MEREKARRLAATETCVWEKRTRLCRVQDAVKRMWRAESRTGAEQIRGIELDRAGIVLVRTMRNGRTRQ